MSKSKDGQSAHQDPPPKPTPAQQASALKLLLVGAAVALALVYFLGQILDHESRTTAFWVYGRYAGVALFAWVGHSIGLGRGRVVAENLECLAIAVVMALILKYFLVEAYKIPTGSMQPTILGDKDTAIFDRVLVNKFAYLVDEPERYDVIVFKFPLDRSKNYIKRLIGLPGERIVLFGGNIYAADRQPDGSVGPMRIARKSRSVREAVMKTVYPSGRPQESFDSDFKVLAGSHSVGNDSITLNAGTRIRYGRGEPVRDRYDDGYDVDWGISIPSHVVEFGKHVVSDLGLRFEVNPGAGCSELRLVIQANDIEHRGILAVGPVKGKDESGSESSTRIESGFVSASGDELIKIGTQGPVVAEKSDLRLQPWKSVEVAFFHVDQELILEVDGEEVLSFPYEIAEESDSSLAPGYYPWPRSPETNAVTLEVRGGQATLSDLEVLRDIHYTTPGRTTRLAFDIPDDALFALGDNTENSHDGRMWAAERVRLPDGTEVLRERRDYGWDTREFIDIYGETRQTPFGVEPVIERRGVNAFNYIPRNLLLGKAIAVFWPIYPHFRWKLLR